MLQKNKQNKKKNNKQMLNMQQQISEEDIHCVDVLINLQDAANVAFDQYTLVSASTDYTDLQSKYGMFKYQSCEVRFQPYFQYSSLITDSAVGVFAIRQGVFDVTVTTKTASNVARIPGSFTITNKNSWGIKFPISGSYFPSAMTNTAVSNVPKVNLYAG